MSEEEWGVTVGSSHPGELIRSDKHCTPLLASSSVALDFCCPDLDMKSSMLRAGGVGQTPELARQRNIGGATKRCGALRVYEILEVQP